MKRKSARTARDGREPQHSKLFGAPQAGSDLPIEKTIAARHGHPCSAAKVCWRSSPKGKALRSPDWNYVTDPDEPYVSPSQIKRVDWRHWGHDHGSGAYAQEASGNWRCSRSKVVNGEEPGEGQAPVASANLRTLTHEAAAQAREQDGDLSIAVLDIIRAVGKGQAA